MTSQPGGYYLPAPSRWPIFGSVALFLMALGAVLLMNDGGGGMPLLLVGSAILIYMMLG